MRLQFKSEIRVIKKTIKKRLKKMAYYSNTAVDFSKKEFNENNTTRIDHKLLKNLLGIQSPSKHEELIIKFIVKFIKDLKDPSISIEMDKMNNLLITKGESNLYPCFAAHMDSVNSVQSDRTIIRLNNCYIGINLNTGEYAGTDGRNHCRQS